MAPRSGIGCGTLPGTGGSDHCCASSVLQNNEICGLNGKQAPCVIEGYTPAPAGLPGTVAPFGKYENLVTSVRVVDSSLLMTTCDQYAPFTSRNRVL